MDAALRGVGELTASVEVLSAVVLDHLAHEERGVFPLIERHLNQAQWRAFPRKERGRLSPREWPEFLAWILGSAQLDGTEALATGWLVAGRGGRRRVTAIIPPDVSLRCAQRQLRSAGSSARLLPGPAAVGADSFGPDAAGSLPGRLEQEPRSTGRAGLL